MHLEVCFFLPWSLSSLIGYLVSLHCDELCMIWWGCGSCLMQGMWTLKGHAARVRNEHQVTTVCLTLQHICSELMNICCLIYMDRGLISHHYQIIHYFRGFNILVKKYQREYTQIIDYWNYLQFYTLSAIEHSCCKQSNTTNLCK